MSQPLIQPHKKLFIDKQVQRVEETHEFIKGSDVGFDIDEIKATPTEELKTIRRSIFEYLKSTKQKKRNANFKEAFLQLNDKEKNYAYELSQACWQGRPIAIRKI